MSLHDAVMAARDNHGAIPVEVNCVDRIRVGWECPNALSYRCCRRDINNCCCGRGIIKISNKAKRLDRVPR